MPVNDIVIRIAGESGEGIVTIGEVFVRIAAFSGLEVYTFRTFPAEILGGHVIFQARIADRPVLSQGDNINVLVSLNQEGYDAHVEELEVGGLVIYDDAVVTPRDGNRHLLYPIPVSRLASSLNFPRGSNLVMVGAIVQLMGLPFERAEQVVRRRLGRYAELLPKNLAALTAGYHYAQEHFPGRPPAYLVPPEQVTEEKLVLTGYQAIALGALAAGCRFFAGYPITPATDLMEFMASELPKAGGTVVQAEDEIAAINMVIGASFAGLPSMTATSGPGLALMIEAIGLASMAEIPVVVVDVQRAGPATGMPTKTAQGDLYMAFYAGADEAPRFVIAPSSVEDCFYQTINAFNMAELYQMPVIILSDQALAPRVETCTFFNLENIRLWKRQLAELRPGQPFERYKITHSGVSPITIPGTPGGQYVAEGLEHDEQGHPNYSPEMHRLMTKKRWNKVNAARHHVFGLENAVEEWGDQDAAIGILGWGSSLGPVKEAMVRAQAAGYRV
ncbi:MAG: 2-oxoacid:acceptor oxidoreductase subunit alpha, partial [Anaerolineae bacterium]|nr:2-oxoacid:acceptor oxidoreductase subunit alpha [Anaerolineae bacterium]MDW8070488.1 2-oxoacid:acceptor oxidoreductase subunit alpha [Anaerolineae bacterium]